MNANVRGHMAEKYVVGVDFGTLSGRAVVVRISDGAELGSAVTDYPNAVIERTLPETGERLGSSWALQDPDDWREVLRTAVPAAVKDAGVDPEDGRRHRHRLHRLDPAAHRSPTAPRCARRPSSAAARTPTRSCGSTTPRRRRPTASPRWPPSATSRGWPATAA